MKSNPLVSVIIPAYNSDSYLEKAIFAVIQDQTYPNIELIVVDDYSTNGTRERLIQLQSKYEFQLILLDKNSGSCSRALNEGIKVAKGKYISICAHDDYYLPNKLQVQIDFLEANPSYMMACSNYYAVYDDNPTQRKLKTLKCRSGNIFSAVFLQKFYLPTLTAIMRNEVFDTVGYFDENLLIEDWDMWLKIAKHFKIAYINKYLACCRVHARNSSTIYSNRMITDRKKIIEKWKNNRYYNAAAAVNRLIEGESIKESFVTLCKDTWIALINLKQPYRVTRLFFANLKRNYINSHPREGDSSP